MSGKKECATYMCVHIRNSYIHVRCKKFTCHMYVACKYLIMHSLVIHEQRQNVIYATYILNTFHMYHIHIFKIHIIYTRYLFIVCMLHTIILMWENSQNVYFHKNLIVRFFSNKIFFSLLHIIRM